ncbi:nuclear transport factor 2 family protein [Sphingomonas xanthus]|uniref:Nuclear transport factor 2 family protein n=1 Tax=Sphingomonas xanthus TaxID=2594473 RepID=A0A516IQM4_9SPHN|nr:nuclear transport factor 2 family protein [Sphingomonas xanthus]QDP19197.1 nuclear transport factor 2 family protein [Sphingomonas xanthus]
MVADAPCTDVRDLERDWRAALIAKDEAALRQLIHPQFKLVGIRSTGSVAVDLEQWIEALKRMDIASLDVRVTECVQLDQVIVATVDAQWQVRYLGQVIDERVLLTDVWVRGGGSWQVIRRHSSPVPPGVTID